MKSIAVLMTLSLSLSGGTLVAQDATIKQLLSKDLVGHSGKELSLVTVEYEPGASDPVHTHDAQAIVSPNVEMRPLRNV
jgi:quercetin dioxygenase-like cupin family protein